MKLFLDANVLVAVLNREYPLYTYAAQLLSLADQPKTELYASPLSLAIAFYFATKKSGTQLAKDKITLLLEHISVADMDGDSITETLQDKRISDLEDGMQYQSALSAGCDVLVTEDTSDYHFSKIPVRSCRDALLLVQERLRT